MADRRQSVMDNPFLHLAAAAIQSTAPRRESEVRRSESPIFDAKAELAKLDLDDNVRTKRRGRKKSRRGKSSVRSHQEGGLTLMEDPFQNVFQQQDVQPSNIDSNSYSRAQVYPDTLPLSNSSSPATDLLNCNTESELGIFDQFVGTGPSEPYSRPQAAEEPSETSLFQEPTPFGRAVNPRHSPSPIARQSPPPTVRHSPSTPLLQRKSPTVAETPSSVSAERTPAQTKTRGRSPVDRMSPSSATKQASSPSIRYDRYHASTRGRSPHTASSKDGSDIESANGGGEDLGNNETNVPMPLSKDYTTSNYGVVIRRCRSRSRSKSPNPKSIERLSKPRTRVEKKPQKKLDKKVEREKGFVLKAAKTGRDVVWDELPSLGRNVTVPVQLKRGGKTKTWNPENSRLEILSAPTKHRMQAASAPEDTEIEKPKKNKWKPRAGWKPFDTQSYIQKRKAQLEAAKMARWQPSWQAIPGQIHRPGGDVDFV